MADDKGSVVLDDSEIFELEERYKKLEERAKIKKPGEEALEDHEAGILSSARKAAGLEE